MGTERIPETADSTVMQSPALLAVYQAVDRSESTAYLLSDTLRIVRTNVGWTSFARANGGAEMLARWGRGSALLDALPVEQRALHRDGLLTALASGVPWELDYECSSPDTYREFRMIAFPIRRTFLAVTHALRVERPWGSASPPAVELGYVEAGVVRMCMHCRRVHVPGSSERWDWVPALVASRPPGISHGMCQPCATFYHLSPPADAF